MSDLGLGDIVEVGRAGPGNHAGTISRGIVYESCGDDVSLLPMIREGDGRLVKISGKDLAEGEVTGEYFALTNNIVRVKSGSVCRTGSLKVGKIDEILRGMIHELVEKHYDKVHADKNGFTPGKDRVQYARRVYDAGDMKALVDSGLDFWLTAGRFAKRFEKDFTGFLGVRHCVITNSGSSANLLAISSLTSPKLGGRRLKAGDEVITTACAFPTSVNPIIQNNLTPVFMDVDVGTYNIIADDVEDALTEKTKAIMLAHTLGNPFDLDKVIGTAKEHGLWVVEDNCDALGSRYDGRYTGTFGDLATFSFYPAHHITMGEGGAVTTNDDELRGIVTSFRDWGRDCWCEPGQDNTCGKRFKWQLGTLPYGYDHKYIYSHIGYNLKVTDMQAAVGVSQLRKLPQVIKARKENWQTLHNGLKPHADHLILPRATEKSDPSWFGFPLTVRQDAGFTRDEMVSHLEENKIATRMLFAGNITRHPSLQNTNYRIHDKLDNTDRIMNDTFWIGLHQGLDERHLEYVISQFSSFIRERKNNVRGP
ncbi:MAG: lipopolysaccharide biosynthesis protein RfbH [Candidatus Altiarchaeota archaeon]